MTVPKLPPGSSASNERVRALAEEHERDEEREEPAAPRE
jgi:hypothetical protein